MADKFSIGCMGGIMAEERQMGSGLNWFVKRGNTVRGPFNSTRVRHFVLEGKLTLEDEVSQDRKVWQRLGQVDEVVPLQMRGGEQALDDLENTDRRRDRRGAIRAIVVVSLIIAALVVAVVLVGTEGPVADASCDAQPVPGVVLEGCDLTGARLTETDVTGARMANVRLPHAALAAGIFDRADMRYADLSRADLSYASMRGTVLLGANLNFADLTNTDLRGADLSFADLRGARLGGARFDGATLTQTIWADGEACEAGRCP